MLFLECAFRSSAIQVLRLADAADFGSLGGSGALLGRSLGALARFRAVLVCYDGILSA